MRLVGFYSVITLHCWWRFMRWTKVSLLSLSVTTMPWRASIHHARPRRQPDSPRVHPADQTNSATTLSSLLITDLPQSLIDDLQVESGQVNVKPRQYRLQHIVGRSSCTSFGQYITFYCIPLHWRHSCRHLAVSVMAFNGFYNYCIVWYLLSLFDYTP